MIVFAAKGVVFITIPFATTCCSTAHYLSLQVWGQWINCVWAVRNILSDFLTMIVGKKKPGSGGRVISEPHSFITSCLIGSFRKWILDPFYSITNDSNHFHPFFPPLSPLWFLLLFSFTLQSHSRSLQSLKWIFLHRTSSSVMWRSD